MIGGALMVAMTTTAFYLITVYAPTFGKTVLHLSTSDSLLVTLCVGVSNFIWLPIGGAISDRIGRKPRAAGDDGAGHPDGLSHLTFLANGPTFTKMLIVLLWLSFCTPCTTARWSWR